jgi:rfaE bifunctional protein nucleotidyltransferase chain/domain
MAVFNYEEDFDKIENISKKLKQKRIIVVSGCFDLFHYGHLEFLRNAKSEGDILIALVSKDKDIQSIKGNSRPIIPGWERAEIIDSLEIVDYTILYDGKVYFELLELIQPYKIAIGSDHLEHKDHLKKLEKYALNGLTIIPRGEYSTTKIIERCIYYHKLKIVKK